MKAYIVKARGIPPYTALARSSCDAIVAAQYAHGIHSVSARPA